MGTITNKTNSKVITMAFAPKTGETKKLTKLERMGKILTLITRAPLPDWIKFIDKVQYASPLPLVKTRNIVSVNPDLFLTIDNNHEMWAHKRVSGHTFERAKILNESGGQLLVEDVASEGNIIIARKKPVDGQKPHIVFVASATNVVEYATLAGDDAHNKNVGLKVMHDPYLNKTTEKIFYSYSGTSHLFTTYRIHWASGSPTKSNIQVEIEHADWQTPTSTIAYDIGVVLKDTIIQHQRGSYEAFAFTKRNKIATHSFRLGVGVGTGSIRGMCRADDDKVIVVSGSAKIAYLAQIATDGGSATILHQITSTEVSNLFGVIPIGNNEFVAGTDSDKKLVKIIYNPNTNQLSFDKALDIPVDAYAEYLARVSGKKFLVSDYNVETFLEVEAK